MCKWDFFLGCHGPSLLNDMFLCVFFLALCFHGIQVDDDDDDDDHDHDRDRDHDHDHDMYYININIKIYIYTQHGFKIFSDLF